MSGPIKKLVFKGLEKKEQILFKSFLNLAQNDLSYEVELIRDPDASMEDVDIVIADAAYEYSGFDKILTDLPTLKIGPDAALVGIGYLQRPVQWSDFKEGLIEITTEVAAAESPEEPRVLPVKLALEEPEDSVEEEEEINQEEVEESTRSFTDASDYDLSLDKLSVDYDRFTTNEYQKVADDVKDFQEYDGDVQGVMLVTDDESAHSNSVLVIETNSLDAWDMSESDFEDVPRNGVDSNSEFEMPELGARERRLAQGKIDAGISITSNDEIWMSEQEVLAGPHSLLFIRPAERKVYSSREPGKWISTMRNKELTSLPLTKDWSPGKDLKSYPIERLIWVNTLVARNDKLDGGALDSQEFMLSNWPHFELLELDNTLLKITTMLFVGPESAYSLMQKTGEGRAVVYGMLNACKELGMLVDPSEIEAPKGAAAVQEDGMFGKIKDVFR